MTPKASTAARDGRLKRAIAFHDAAEVVEQFMNDGTDLRDAYVTLCVHAGIAAADVICMDALGEYYSGQRHDQAARLLARVDVANSRSLTALLAIKTRAGYSDVPVSNDQLARAKRSMNDLVGRASR